MLEECELQTGIFCTKGRYPADHGEARKKHAVSKLKPILSYGLMAF